MTRPNLHPDPRLRFEPEALGLREFPRAFFCGDTREIARALIGTWFARRCAGAWYGARLVETEAYLGSKDPAAHSIEAEGRRGLSQCTWMAGTSMFISSKACTIAPTS